MRLEEKEEGVSESPDRQVPCVRKLHVCGLESARAPQNQVCPVFCKKLLSIALCANTTVYLVFPGAGGSSIIKENRVWSSVSQSVETPTSKISGAVSYTHLTLPTKIV